MRIVNTGLQYLSLMICLILTSCHSSIAFGRDSAKLEFALGLGGGPTIARVDDRLTNFATGTSHLAIGSRWSNGYHLDLLLEQQRLSPLITSEAHQLGHFPEYRMTMGSIGFRIGKRWSRLHLWADAAAGTRSEEYEDDTLLTTEVQPKESSFGSVGAGLGFNLIQSDSFSLEIFSHLRRIGHPPGAEFSQPIASNMTTQSHGLLLNFYLPTDGHQRSSAHHHWFYCHCHVWVDAVRLVFDFGRIVGPHLGEAMTRAVFLSIR